MNTGPGHEESPADVVSLPEATTALLEQARTHPSGRAARTVVAGATLRATVMALAAGAELAEHDPPPAATLQILSGTVHLHAGERTWSLSAGEVMPIPRERHGVHADTDAVFLLTVALH